MSKMTTASFQSRPPVEHFRTKPEARSRTNVDLTKCGQTVCGPNHVCMLSMCLCPDTHMPPNVDGDCTQNEVRNQGAQSNHDGVLHPHHIRGILGSSSNNNNSSSSSRSSSSSGGSSSSSINNTDRNSSIKSDAAFQGRGSQVSASESIITSPPRSPVVHTLDSPSVAMGSNRRGGAAGFTRRSGTTALPGVATPFAHTSADTQTMIKDNVTRIVLSVTVSVALLLALIFLLNFFCRRYRRFKIRQGRSLSGRRLLRRTETLEENALYGQVRPLVMEALAPDPQDHLLEGLLLLGASRLRIVHRVGDGAFGTVYKAWLSPDPETQEAEDGGPEKTLPRGQGHQGHQGQGQGHQGHEGQGEGEGDRAGDKLVAVKTLRDSSTGRARREFLSECKIMAALHHPNIITFHGVVLLDGIQAPQLVTEFAVHGDLATALRKNDPSMRGKEEDFLLISKDQLLWVCQQVAAGMEYLSRARFIHRDLAARNCLLMDHLHVKISDFGMSRDVYTSESYKVEGSRLLPVRWMSPECLRYGQFTVSSDVWAFGVLLWEVYTYGRQPYCGFSNIQVMQLICQGKLLERPDDCPDQVARVMAACCTMSPQDRCSFAHICRMLQDPKAVQQDPGSEGSKETLLELYDDDEDDDGGDGDGGEGDDGDGDGDGGGGGEDDDSVFGSEGEGEDDDDDCVTVTWDDSALCDADGQCFPLNPSCEGVTSV